MGGESALILGYKKSPAVERSEWDPETLIEGQYDTERTMRRFEEANGNSGASGAPDEMKLKTGFWSSDAR